MGFVSLQDIIFNHLQPQIIFYVCMIFICYFVSTQDNSYTNTWYSVRRSLGV